MLTCLHKTGQHPGFQSPNLYKLQPHRRYDAEKRENKLMGICRARVAVAWPPCHCQHHAAVSIASTNTARPPHPAGAAAGTCDPWAAAAAPSHRQPRASSSGTTTTRRSFHRDAASNAVAAPPRYMNI
jgi:hypothetical protein